MIDYRTPTPAQIDQARTDAIAEAEHIVSSVIEVPDAGRTYANTLQPLEEVDDLLGQTFGRYGFLAYVSPDAAVRSAAQQLREALDKFSNEISFREDLYAAVTAYAASAEAQSLTGERRRLLERVLRDYRRNGFGLPAEARTRVKELRNRLVEIALAFRRNIDEWDDAIFLTREDLAGLPDDYIDRLTTVEQDGQTRYRVSLDYPEFFPFMDNAESEDLRRALMIKSLCKGGVENVALLEEAIAVRDEIAHLLGYPSWAAYVLEVRMASTPETAQRFLDDLHARIMPLLAHDLEELRAEKADHTGRADARLELWDWRFYHHRILRSRYAVDDFMVAQYFPLEAVLDGLFDVFQTLFGIRFEPVEPTHAWHPDVKLFRILDMSERSGAHRGGSDAARTLAYVFMDLFPRPNKYGHAAAFTLRGGRRRVDGSYQRPVSAIVANFTKPGPDHPSLLRHTEVETLFHEFGHILHQTLTATECLRFSGSKTERDFVEAPSQMLEHWVWLPEVLRRFTRHIETGEPLPDALLERMITTRYLHAGIFIARQLFFAKLDLACHGPGAHKDSTALVRMLHPITGFGAPEGTHFQAGFGHLFGYDAGYYGYLWSEVYADDMFTRFQAAGPLNADLGLEYRRTVLERGGAVDGTELVRDFLGREPSSAAFLRNRGL